MFEIKGLNGESIVVDGEWVEKLRAGDSVARQPASGYVDTTVDEVAAKKFVVFGEREELLNVTVRLASFMGLMVPIEKRGEVDQLQTELAAARDRAAAS